VKRHQNLILLIAVVLLAIFPLWLIQKPAPDAQGHQSEIFAGADNKAMALIGEIAPDYKPWFKPLLEPASNEIASLLFAVQAALGAGFIGYYLGVAVTREKMRKKEKEEKQKSAANGSSDPC